MYHRCVLSSSTSEGIRSHLHVGGLGSIRPSLAQAPSCFSKPRATPPNFFTLPTLERVFRGAPRPEHERRREPGRAPRAELEFRQRRRHVRHARRVRRIRDTGVGVCLLSRVDASQKLASSRGSRRASPRSSFENDDRLEDGRGVSVLEIFFEKDEGVADAGLLSLLSGTSCSG